MTLPFYPHALTAHIQTIQNVPEGASAGGTVPGMKAPKNSEFYADEIPEGAMGERILGREKVADVQADLIDQSEMASREP